MAMDSHRRLPESKSKQTHLRFVWHAYVRLKQCSVLRKYHIIRVTICSLLLGVINPYSLQLLHYLGLRSSSRAGNPLYNRYD